MISKSIISKSLERYHKQISPPCRATFLKSVQDEKDSLQGKSVTEIKEYVRKLKEVNIQQEKNLLSLHTSIALHLKAVVTNSIFARRLECEQGMVQGTIPTDKYLDYCEERLCRSEPPSPNPASQTPSPKCQNSKCQITDAKSPDPAPYTPSPKSLTPLPSLPCTNPFSNPFSWSPYT